MATLADPIDSIDELLGEYFRLLTAGRRIEKFEFDRLQSTWLAQLQKRGDSSSVRLSRNFANPEGIELRRDLDKLIEGTKIDKNALISAVKAVCRKKTYSDSDIKKLLKPITDRHAAIEAEAEKIPNLLGKARSYLTNTSVALNDIDAVNASHSKFPSECIVIRELLNEFHNDGAYRSQRGYETEWSISWYKFLACFVSGGVKALMFLSEVEINTRHSISDVIRDMSDAILNKSTIQRFQSLFPCLEYIQKQQIIRSATSGTVGFDRLNF
jgi:hypothetical protein